MRKEIPSEHPAEQQREFPFAGCNHEEKISSNFLVSVGQPRKWRISAASPFEGPHKGQPFPNKAYLQQLRLIIFQLDVLSPKPAHHFLTYRYVQVNVPLKPLRRLESEIWRENKWMANVHVLYGIIYNFFDYKQQGFKFQL